MRFSKKRVIQVFISVLLITLFFGLKPKGYRFFNKVNWLENRNGIVFKNAGMVYSEKKLEKAGISDELSIVAVLHPYRACKKLSKIITIIDDNGKDILSVEQWINEIMVTLFDSSEKKITTLGITNSLLTGKNSPVIISVNRTSLSISTDSTERNCNYQHFRQSVFFKEGILIAGLSAEGRNPWQGEISSLALFNHKLTDELRNELLSREIPANFNKILENNKPSAFFTFKAEKSITISDQSGNRWSLKKPLFIKIFRRNFLKIIPEFYPLISFISDTLINFFGFIPLGIICNIMLLQCIGKYKRPLLLTVILCLSVSLGIELIQAYIPARTSQLPDVFLNSAGALAGAALVRTRFFSRSLMKKNPVLSKVL